MSRIISFQIAEEDYTVLAQVSKLRGEDLSSLLRRSLKIELARLGYLTGDQVRALRAEITGSRVNAK